MQANRATVSLLSTLLEIFATARSALATYAVSMVVFNGDQPLSLFTVGVVEGALVLSMFSIGLDAVSPITAIVALAFSAIMQWVEIVTITGVLSAEEKQTLMMALAFAPSVLLAMGILRRLSSGGDGLLESARGWLGGLVHRGSKSMAFDSQGGNMAWLEKRKVGDKLYWMERWIGEDGKRHAKYRGAVKAGERPEVGKHRERKKRSRKQK